jgi:hypothetical protein
MNINYVYGLLIMNFRLSFFAKVINCGLVWFPKQNKKNNTLTHSLSSMDIVKCDQRINR